MSRKWQSVPVRTKDRVVDIGWFNDIIAGDTEFLGEPDLNRRSSLQHCAEITEKADTLGFNTILYPTAYVVGQEAIPFTSATGSSTKQIKILTAIRTGEIHPPTLARTIANIDHQLKGRFAINIINSDLPGSREDPEIRYKRCAEVIEILKQGWTKEKIDFDGEIYRFNMPSDPVKPYQNDGPMLFFGGTSPGSRDLCARYCDVFLSWPEREESLYATLQDMSQRAAAYGRIIDFGLRIHIIVRETESEAREYAKKLMSKYDEKRAQEIRSRGEDSRSYGVVRQDELRKEADKDGFIEDIIWTDIGKVFSGCGSGLVGTPDQLIAKLETYMDMGFRAFILSGFPLIEESEYVSKLLLPKLKRTCLASYHGKIPTTTPETPLTYGKLK